MYKKILFVIICFFAATSIEAQQLLNLNECRNLAIENNKTLKIASVQEQKAYYEKREALMQYFPKVSASGSYSHLSRKLHLIGNEVIPTSIPLPPALGGSFLLSQETRDRIYKMGEVNLSDSWSLGFTLTQPIFTGGKIIALNDIRSYAKELAATMKETAMTDVIVEVDEAYWQVVSMSNKTKLAQSLVQLLQKMDSDINYMLDEGVVTKADRLSVNVKLNETEILLTKAENGLSLSKMVLCQIMGINISDDITLADENLQQISMQLVEEEYPNAEEVIKDRSEIRSLDIASKIYHKQEQIAIAEFLPRAGLQVGYNWDLPNLHNGVQRKFGGMWNIGVAVTIPLNIVTNTYKLKSAKSESLMHQYKIEDAKDKIRLQINQSTYKLNEANKKLRSTEKNAATANENLRYADAGFEEGVISASDALAAHTAWMSAHAEMIDAQIDYKLCRIYLDRAFGKKLIIE